MHFRVHLCRTSARHCTNRLCHDRACFVVNLALQDAVDCVLDENKLFLYSVIFDIVVVRGVRQSVVLLRRQLSESALVPRHRVGTRISIVRSISVGEAVCELRHA